MENAVAGFCNADIAPLNLRTIPQHQLLVLLETPAEMLIEIAKYLSPHEGEGTA